VLPVLPRWKLRKAVKLVNEVLASLGLEKHPDKTFIGRIERGFDFIGYHFSPDGLTAAPQGRRRLRDLPPWVSSSPGASCVSETRKS
jgi:hypothetical protein